MNMGNWVPALKDVFDAAKGVFVKDPLDVYTQYTGGRQCGFKSDKALANCVAQIGEELHSQYLLSYHPEQLDEPGFHRIVVEVLKPGLQSARARRILDRWPASVSSPNKPARISQNTDGKTAARQDRDGRKCARIRRRRDRV